MDWQAIGAYHNAGICVRERQKGCWVAVLVPVPKSGMKEPPLIFPSEESALPVVSGPQTAAVKAAMQCIDQRLEHGVRPEGTPGSTEEIQEAGPASKIRRFERISVSLPAVGWAPQFPGMQLRGGRHIAAGGLMVEFPVEVVPGSTLRVLLETRQPTREVEGKVVWTAAIANTIRHGVCFPESQGLEFLDEYCHDDDG
jgi:hypothetical protein